ncbi:methyltransferase domain-containing protein [Aquimarina sp. RZ0]|uniref:methyltransferase domain-containing protein n=1 Tax=Aquimarina sp. RZ0 TaxID=2607730 RepID=UPI0011F15A9D|nr:methyltransferase domain-containing protein [Aquimarina sp. RZ0]KAA1246853.1 methyltransferase domain-containing protein [Aquimarina sp. RZ0]
MNTNQSEERLYWTKRYDDNRTGWDIGYISTPIKEYIDQISQKDIRILIPGAGNGYEAEYLFSKGFNNVFVMDISDKPLIAFAERVPNFPNSQLICEDFFAHIGEYDLIIEQTFFCSFLPTKKKRIQYFSQMSTILSSKGKLIGLWFDIPLKDDIEKRPFGGNKNLYLSYLQDYFEVIVFEKCYNSIPERKGNELFGILKKINS